MELVLCNQISASIMDETIRLVCTIGNERAVLSMRDGRLKYAYSNGKQSRRLISMLARADDPAGLIKKACIDKAPYYKLQIDVEGGRAVVHFIGKHVSLRVASKKRGLLAIIDELTSRKDKE